MRRPVKPFVTEYRGAARRNNAAGAGAKSDFLKAEPERSEPRQPNARFAASTRHAEQQEDSYEAALRAADALFSGARQPAAPQDEVLATSVENDPAPHPTGGRVLRAIDEPPPAEMLRLEAEFAPKRRGRKPGSKNKPKMAPARPALAAEAPYSAGSAIAAAPVAVALAAAPRIAPRAQVLPVRTSRYAWVRTKLKPGEQWKRRIPKIAW